MTADKKTLFQSRLYKILYALVFLMTVFGAVLSTRLYMLHLDEELLMFNKCTESIVFTALSLAVGVLCLFVLLAQRLFDKADRNTSWGGVFTMLFSSFIFFFLIAYSLVYLYGTYKNGWNIGVIEVLNIILPILSGMYFFVPVVKAEANKSRLAIFGIIFAVFLIFTVFTVHYSSSTVLMNSPVRIGSLLSCLSVMLFILSEVRYVLGIASSSMYIGFGFACSYFTITSTLPVILLTLKTDGIFEFSANTIFLCVQLLAGVYSALRIGKYLKKENFCYAEAGEKSPNEVYENIILTADQTKGSEGERFREGFSNDGAEEVYIFDTDVSLSEAGENELPDNIGFKGGHEGHFELYSDAAAEMDDDYDDEEEMSPFENTDFGDFIKEAMEESSKDLEAVIDFERKRNALESGDKISLEAVFEAAEDEEREEALEDEEIENDVNKVINELSNTAEIKNKENDSKEGKGLKKKFRFVKKM